MTRLYGRSLSSERCIDYTPHGHWHTNTFIAALRHDRIDAPILFDGPMNAVTFLQYVEQILAPTLDPGDIVICDNLSSHKSSEVRDALQKVGADIAYLPPYSPDMNPIEMVFSQNQSLPEREPVRVVRSNCAPVAHAPFQRAGVRVTGPHALPIEIPSPPAIERQWHTLRFNAPECGSLARKRCLSSLQARLQSCASGTRSVSTCRSAGHWPACADSRASKPACNRAPVAHAPFQRAGVRVTGPHALTLELPSPPAIVRQWHTLRFNAPECGSPARMR
jgi:hypothetical protein